MSQRASRLNVAAIASGPSTGGRWRRVGAAAVAALGLSGAAMADNISWVGAAGTPAPFEVGSNWAGGNVPDADDLSFIDNGGVASLTTYTGEVLTVSLGSGTSTSGTLVQGGGSLSSLAGIFIAGHATASGTYTMNAGTLRGNDFYIGSKGVGTFNLNGGTVISAAAFRLADDEGSTGVMNMTGGTVSVPAHFLVGHFSPAGSGSITTGTFNLSGGTLTAAHYNLGQHPNARGEVHQTGGFVNNTANTVIGEHSRLANLYDLSGGTLRVAGGPAGGSVFVASSRGVGELRISGTGNAQIDGHIQVAGGTADTSLPVAMGTFNLSGGTVVLGLNKPEGGFLIAGEFGTATVAISGGNFTSDFLQLGRRAFVSSQGQATQTGGNVTVRRSMTIGGLSANDNFYRISGGTLNMTNDLGAGTLNETQSGIHVARFSVNPGTFAPATEYSRARFTVDGTAVVNIAGGLYNSTGFTGVITKAGGGTQSVQLPGGAGTVEVLGGTLTAGSFLNGGAANAGSFNNGGATANYVQSGGVATLGPVTGTGNVAVSGGTMNVNSLSQAAATVSGNGTVRVAPNGTSAGTSRVNTLAISGSGRFDLTNNALVVDYTGASPLADVRADIVSAYAGGAWTGPGLTSTQATANTHGVGYGEASSLTSIPEIFGTVDATAVLARHTRYGDANLDGTVNLADFNRLAANFGATNAVWTQGDFNYDSIVNLSDFNRLAANFGQNAAGAAVTPEDWANLASAIPEPGALGLAGLGAVAALVRRRRRAV